MSDHLNWDALNDFVDGLLPAEERPIAEGHLADCAQCEMQLTQLRALVAQAASPSPEIDAPDVWGDVHGAILRQPNQRGAAPVVGDLSIAGRMASAPAPAGARRIAIRASWLVAASLMLVVGSSAMTAWLMRPIRQSSDATTRGAAALRAVSLPADIQDSEREYLKTADALRVALEKERQRLSPETIAIVERSLTVIEGAIGEARQALLRDPSNRELRDLWSRNHQQKLDLLRRAALLVQA